MLSVEGKGSVDREEIFPGITVTTDLDDILSDDSVRGVFVSASPSAHFGIASEVLKANKALFVEKPPCGTLEELDVLTRLADQRNVPAVVGMQKRYSPVTRRYVKLSVKMLQKATASAMSPGVIQKATL